MKRIQLLEALCDCAACDAVVVTDADGRLIYWNHAAEHGLGLNEKSFHAAFDHLFRNRDGEPNGAAERAQALASGRVTAYYVLTRPGCPATGYEAVTAPLFLGRSTLIGFATVFHERPGAGAAGPAHPHHSHDQVTGLPGRREFDDNFARFAVESERKGESFALLMINVDQFRLINDTEGRARGDELLRSVATCLRKAVRRSDLLCRFEADRFLVAQADVATATDVQRFAEKIIETLQVPFELDDRVVHITVTVGIAVAPADGVLPRELLRNAELALERAQRGGRNCAVFFSLALDRDARARARDVIALQDAVRAMQFHLVYQPKVLAENGIAVAAEALLRCDHPLLRGRPINEVIDMAKRHGHIAVLSNWIVMEACAQVRRWQDAGVADCKVCVNLCAKELASREILALVDRALDLHELAADCLVLEMTEQEVFECKEEALDVLRSLRARGIAIALDDFGTGYSSLGHMTSLPIDFIKMDMSFVRNVPDDLRACAVVSAIIDLAHRIDLKVIAEGVERAEQAAFLQGAGCDELQGYFFGRPALADRMFLSR
jgi:diguanylate cyclase (GGDEF)-like protein